MSDMTREQAAAILEAHNAWRRYDGAVEDAPEMGQSEEIGRAIDTAVECLRAQAAPAVEVPEGWKLVPEVPNQSMVHAAQEVDGRLSVFKWAVGYYAMLDAAPQPAPADHLPEAGKMIPQPAQEGEG